MFVSRHSINIFQQLKRDSLVIYTPKANKKKTKKKTI
jgi:hypothetical protein